MVHNQVAELFTGGANNLPAVNHLFAYVTVEKGNGYLVEIKDDQIIKTVESDDIDYFITKYYKDALCFRFPKYGFPKISDIETVAKHITNNAQRITSREIYAAAPKGFNGYARHKLAYDLDCTDPHPIFDSIVARLTINKDAVLAWIGSLCDPYADHSQLFFLLGDDGNEGKSSIIELIHNAFGPSAAVTYLPSEHDRFWESDVYDKRVATVAECEPDQAVISTRIKKFTGDTMVRVEQKGRSAFTSVTCCKFLLASNDMPTVSNIMSNNRRIIFSQLTKFEGKVDPKYKEKFFKEERAIIATCYRKYRELCPDGGPIPTEEGAFKLLVDNSNTQFDEMFEQYFVADPDLALKQLNVELLFKNRKHTGNTLVKDFMRYLKLNRGLSKKGVNRRYRLADGTSEQRKLFIGVGIKGKYLVDAGMEESEILQPTDSQRSFEQWNELRHGLGLAKIKAHDGTC